MIEATDWTFLQNETVDLACDIWEKKFMEIMEKCIPKVTISTKHNLPWMSSTIKAGKRKRNYRRARKLDAHLYGTSTPHPGIRL